MLFEDNNYVRFFWFAMRYSADWMVLADDRILEFLSENGPRSPSKMHGSGDIRYSRGYINSRCQKLANFGLVLNIGNGVYQITKEGEQYLDGDLDAIELENN